MRALPAVLALLFPLAFGACGNPGGYYLDPTIVTDTVVLAAPTSSTGLPSALDLTTLGTASHGARYPERVEDSGAWDVALRVRDGALVFAPAGALGVTGTGGRAAITRPISGKTYDQLNEAPGRTAFLTDSTVVVRESGLYAVRSRLLSCGYSGGEQYAKLQVLDLVPAEQRVRLQVTTNFNCTDPRLAERG